MKSSQAAKIISKVDTVIEDINSFLSITELEKSYLAGFLVVYICGIYEEVIETIINDKVNKSNDYEISNYIKESVSNTFRNPDMQNIKKLLGKFKDGWKSEIAKLPENAQIAVDNIVNIKNSLAHGNNVTVTLRDVIQYYNDSLVVINKIDDMLL